MKNLIYYAFTIGMAIVFVNCQPPEIDDFEECDLDNQSGHTVSVVVAEAIWNDSLVLLNGKNNDAEDALFLVENINSNKIYYDGRYMLKFSELPSDRKIYDKFCYHSRTDGMGWLWYTFTEDDYLYAVEHGTDLEAGK